MPDRSTDKFLSREVGSNEPYEGQIDGEIFAIRSGSSVFGIAGADGQAEAARQEAEAARQEAEEQRAEAQQANDAAQDANDSAQQSNDTAQTANDAAQAKNNADQAANNQAAQGLQVVILTDGQYDPETREPTGTGNAGDMYFVPTEGDTEDTYVEWMWINSAWERVGMTNATLDPITTDQIDAVASDQSPTGDQTLNTTGLSYLWTKLKAAFSAIGHKHSAEDVTSGTLPVERGGTAASTAEGALTSLGAASATDLEELRESLSQTTLECIAGESYVVDNPSLMGNGIYAMRCGHMVTLMIRGGSAWGPTVTSNGWGWTDALPEKYRPMKTLPATWVAPGSTQYGTATISNAGRISLGKSYGADTNYYQLIVTYPAAS